MAQFGQDGAAHSHYFIWRKPGQIGETHASYFILPVMHYRVILKEGDDDMWSEDDRITRIKGLSIGKYPKKCPICEKNSIHLLMYKPKTKTASGGCWVWCSVCKKYSHTSLTIPEWWRNYNELKECQLFSSPEYNIDDKKEDIDKWVNKLISEKQMVLKS